MPRTDARCQQYPPKLIRWIRATLWLTQKQFGRICFASDGSVGRWEREGDDGMHVQPPHNRALDEIEKLYLQAIDCDESRESEAADIRRKASILHKPGKPS